jgi:hypothetical protein
MAIGVNPSKSCTNKAAQQVRAWRDLGDHIANAGTPNPALGEPVQVRGTIPPNAAKTQNGAAATCIGCILAAGMTGGQTTDRNIQRTKVLGLCPFVVLIAGKQLRWAASDDTFLVAAACVSLTAVA